MYFRFCLIHFPVPAHDPFKLTGKFRDITLLPLWINRQDSTWLQPVVINKNKLCVNVRVWRLWVSQTVSYYLMRTISLMRELSEGGIPLLKASILVLKATVSRPTWHRHPGKINISHFINTAQCNIMQLCSPNGLAGEASAGLWFVICVSKPFLSMNSYNDAIKHCRYKYLVSIL